MPDSSATNKTGLFVNLFDIIVSDILSLSSLFKIFIKLLILLVILSLLSTVSLLFLFNFEMSTLPLVMDLNL